jgi:predicted nucleic-acid-binding protein
MSVLRNDFNRAITAKSSLTMAIRALQDSSKHVTDKRRLSRLVEAVGVLEQELRNHDEIIDRINLLVQNFDKTLISHANTRLYAIDQLIKVNAEFIATKQKNYLSRMNEAAGKRINLEDCRPLDTEPTAADRAANAAEKAALLAEQSLLNEFMKAGPLFDTERLKQTALASLISA